LIIPPHTLLSNPPSPTELSTLSLHDALPIWSRARLATHESHGRHLGRDRSSGAGPCSQRWRSRAVPHCRHGRRANGPTPYEPRRSEEHTSELQSRFDLVCRLLLEKKK